MTAPGPAGNVVCDLDGVLYIGETAVPGAGEALTALRGRGYRIVLVTNNSTRSRAEVAAHVAALTGFEPEPDLVLGSGLATVHHLDGTVRCALVVGEPGLAAELQDGGIEVVTDWRDADAVVVGLHRTVGYADLRDASLAVRAGARFVATNLDPTYPTPDGLWPGGGAIAGAIAVAAERSPEVCGKPYPPMRRLVQARLGLGPTWVVGDRADTDLEMGRLEGWERVLVLSGATPSAAGLDGEYRPELVLASISDLPGALP